MILPTSFSRESRPPRPSATRSSVLLLKGSVRVRGGVLGSSRADSRLLSAARGGSREVRICSWRRRASSAYYVNYMQRRLGDEGLEYSSF